MFLPWNVDHTWGRLLYIFLLRGFAKLWAWNEREAGVVLKHPGPSPMTPFQVIFYYRCNKLQLTEDAYSSSSSNFMGKNLLTFLESLKICFLEFSWILENVFGWG